MAIVIYARKSVERENSISCETQLEYCRSMIRPDERAEEIIPIVDNGFSGGNINREGFQKMMKLISQGKVSKVIGYKIDRISRSLSDFIKILDDFKAHHVQFISSQESFDTTSPYGEMIIKLLMVFAEFERTSTIERVTQAYAHRSEMGFYMGGRRPYGFELVPAVIRNIKTKKLEPIPGETEQIRYIYEVYAQENVSLRRLQNLLASENRFPLDGSHWTTSKLSTLLKNPIYVKADSEIYRYFENKGVQMISDLSMFTGEYGAQLYGQTRHKRELPDWSDMKLVLLTHPGTVDSDIWLRCQRKLEKNKQITNSYSNTTSWLAGKVICKKCGHTMTTVKGNARKNGEIRRYFSCTGKSHKKICTGAKVTVYAEDLEAMVHDCIREKLSGISGSSERRDDPAEINGIKLKILAIEKSCGQIVDMLLADDVNSAMKELLNQRAAQLKQEKKILNDRIEEIRSKAAETAADLNYAEIWQTADYECRKSIAMRMIHQIVIKEDGDVEIIWNI